MSLTLARLDALTKVSGGTKPQRVGLSATVRPIEVVADYLSTGASVVDVGHRRDMDLSIEVPNDELGAVATSEMWAEIYDRIARHISKPPNDAGVRQYPANVRAYRARAGRAARRQCCTAASR